MQKFEELSLDEYMGMNVDQLTKEEKIQLFNRSKVLIEQLRNQSDTEGNQIEDPRELSTDAIDRSAAENQRPARFEVFFDKDPLIRNQCSLNVHIRNKVVHSPSIGRERLKIKHDASYYNQYGSRFQMEPTTMSNVLECCATHIEYRLSDDDYYQTPSFLGSGHKGLTFVMDCKISYMRGANGDPHGGSLLSIGRWGLGRRTIELLGLLDDEWHRYTICLQDHVVTLVADDKIVIIESAPDHPGYLTDFYTGEEEILTRMQNRFPYLSPEEVAILRETSDSHRYKANNGLTPRRVVFGASVCDNNQLYDNNQHHALSMYARTDCETKNVYLWDYHMTPIRALIRSQGIIDSICVPLAVISAMKRTQSGDIVVPDSVLVLITEYAIPALYSLTAQRLVTILAGIQAQR